LSQLFFENILFTGFVHKLLIFRLLQNIGLRHCNKKYILDFLCILPLYLNHQTNKQTLHLQFFKVNNRLDKKQTLLFLPLNLTNELTIFLHLQFFILKDNKHTPLFPPRFNKRTYNFFTLTIFHFKR